MKDRRHASGWRATALAVALFAITCNFLQPVAHAALMRDGAPSTLWSMFCKAAAPDSRHDAPVAANKHACCLGLAHAVVFAPPTPIFTPIERAIASTTPLRTLDQLTPVGSRDGPHRPRGPPSFV
jgi:hypothetical protein